MYASVGLLLVTYRVGKPVRDAVRHGLRVDRIVAEGPGLTSIYVTGRRLTDLHAVSGQFFMWRFLTRDGWWQAHPYSLSAAPNRTCLRITVKHLGDHSAGLAHLRPGVRVMLEGPYGAFTEGRRTRRKVLLIAGGVGITPLRALFESLSGRPGDVTLIYRARTADDVVFRHELDVIAAARRVRLHYLVGSTTRHPEYLTARHLTELVPDVARRDVYLCGPSTMSMITSAALQAAGVPRRHIYREDFEL